MVVVTSLDDVIRAHAATFAARLREVAAKAT